VHAPDGRNGDMLDSGGLYRMLLDGGFTPDIWTPYELTRQGEGALDAYDVVFVSDCPALPESAYAVLAAYIEQGGEVLGSGQAPTRNLAAEPLDGPFTRLAVSSANPLSATHGAGRITWFSTPLGRAYWGKVTPTRVHGNTPAVLMEVPGGAPDAYTRQRLRTQWLDQVAHLDRPARLVAPTGDVHLAVHRHRESNRRIAFLVHKGAGRAVAATVAIAQGHAEPDVEVWLDFDRRVTLPVNDAGEVTLPSFAHSALIFMTGR